MSAGIDLALAIVARVADDETAQAIQLLIKYDPQPPLDAGSPSKAPQPIVDLVREILQVADAQASSAPAAAQAEAPRIGPTVAGMQLRIDDGLTLHSLRMTSVVVPVPTRQLPLRLLVAPSNQRNQRVEGLGREPPEHPAASRTGADRVRARCPLSPTISDVGEAEDVIRQRIAREQAIKAAEADRASAQRVAEWRELIPKVRQAVAATLDDLRRSGWPDGELRRVQRTKNGFFTGGSFTEEVAGFRVGMTRYNFKDADNIPGSVYLLATGEVQFPGGYGPRTKTLEECYYGELELILRLLEEFDTKRSSS